MNGNLTNRTAQTLDIRSWLKKVGSDYVDALTRGETEHGEGTESIIHMAIACHIATGANPETVANLIWEGIVDNWKARNPSAGGKATEETVQEWLSELSQQEKMPDMNPAQWMIMQIIDPWHKRTTNQIGNC